MMHHYILKGKEVVPAELLEWAMWFETADRKVAETELANGLLVSTVFLGADHQFGEGVPLLFETMVFPGGGNLDEQDCDRYSTWDEAVAGHEEMVNKWETSQ